MEIGKSCEFQFRDFATIALDIRIEQIIERTVQVVFSSDIHIR